MPSRPINPDTHEYIQTATEFGNVADRIARSAAGLPEYAMDDPGRPFTPEYDEPVIQDETVADEPEAPRIPTSLELKMAGILERVREREAAASLAGHAAITGEMAEDPWASLGGGHNTFHQKGHLPVGVPEDARTYTTRGRGGRLVTRVKLAGRFLDVPIHDSPGQPSNWSAVEKAKDQLARGIGTPVAKLRRGSKR